jgi:hypothetical protein
MAKDKTAPSLGAAPTNLDDHNKDMETREGTRRKKRPLLLDCLDPTVAKFHEDRKEIWEWRVHVKLFRPAKGKQQARMEPFDTQVVAQNEQDAWALFCDTIEEWPSRRDSNPTITRLKKRTLRADDVPASLIE